MTGWQRIWPGAWVVSAGMVVTALALAHAELGGLAWLGPASAWAHPVPNADREPVLHSSRFVLVDRQAQIRGYYHGTDWESLARLRDTVKRVLREQSKEP